jgi:hypothetical protein
MAILISKAQQFKISGYLLLMISIIGITISLLGRNKHLKQKYYLT